MEYTEILINIRKIVRSVNLESKKIQKEYGVSIPQLLTLGYLASRDNYRATHAEITKYLHLNSSTVTGIINRLENKGYIARLPRPEDRRSVFIALTSGGAQLLEKSPRLLHEKLSEKLQSLSVEKLDEINRTLQTLIESLGIEKISASPMVTIEDYIHPPDNPDLASS
ncbi:MAG: MarR family transcriptional regulator [Bacteroidales bacterium]|nr:MarR family transcriptional regulator [Bacteroidales bacterium]